MSAQVELRKELCPDNAEDYAAAVQHVPGGQFLARCPEETARNLATLYGAPMYALSSLAPEVVQQEAVSIMLGGLAAFGVRNGGRWFTLYSRVLQPACKAEYVICAARKPKPSKAAKELLAQPPQRVLNQGWREYLDQAGSPDVVVLDCSTFNELWETLSSEQIRGAAKECAVLLQFQSEAEAIMARSIGRAMNFDVSDVVPFCRTTGVAQNLMPGAWWLRVRLASSDARSPDLDEKESFQSCYDGYRSFLDAAEGIAKTSEIAEVYGTRREVEVGGKAVLAVLATPAFGIECSSGRIFRGSDSSALCWTGERIHPRVMRMLPDASADGSSVGRYQLMLWLARALATEAEKFTEEPEQIVGGTTGGPEPIIELSALGEGSASDAIVTSDVADKPGPVDERIAGASGKIEPFRKRTTLALEAGVTNVLAVAARLGAPGSDSGDGFVRARQEVLRWLKGKGFDLDSEKASQIVETPVGEVSIEAEGEELWSVRFDDRAQMASGAFWRVEATLLANGREPAAIGLRVSQVRQSVSAPPPVPGVPRVLAEIAANIGLHDTGVSLKQVAWRVNGRKQAEHLLSLLLDRRRVQPVIVVSLGRGLEFDTAIDRLASRLTGVAHVMCIDAEAAETMILRLGRNLSVYGSAVRLYKPGFSEDSDPFRQPLWTYSRFPLPVRVVNEVSEEACALGIQAGDIDERVPSFQRIRNAIAAKKLRAAEQVTREVASSADEERERQQAVRVSLEAMLASYKEQNDEFERKNRQIARDLEAVSAERDSALDEIRRLKYQINAVRPGERSDLVIEEEVGEKIEYPDNWDDMEAWVECYGSDRLVLLPQAVKAARSSPFLDIQFAYRVLEFLADHYVALRTRDPDDDETRIQYDKAMTELGVQVGPVGDAVDDKRYKKQYRRKYEGETIKLDLHVKRGVGFDGSTLFRLYFFYDEERSKVVVGHFPTHLTNRISHSG